MPKVAGTTALPFPSMVRASAWDVGNARMRKAGRTQWTRGDYNAAARFQQSVIEKCFAVEGGGYPEACIKFSIAEALQRAGHLPLGMKSKAFFATIDQAYADYLASFEQQAAIAKASA